MDRRDLLKTAAVAMLPLTTDQILESIQAAVSAAEPAAIKTGSPMKYRTLGRTGEKVSMIGLGGFHIGKVRDPEESVRIIRSAINQGLTFMDNSWDYNEGQSEIRMGNVHDSTAKNPQWLG